MVGDLPERVSTSGLARLRRFGFSLAVSMVTLALFIGFSVAVGPATVVNGLWLMGSYAIAYPGVYLIFVLVVQIMRGPKPAVDHETVPSNHHEVRVDG